jgi:hypothetical protein
MDLFNQGELTYIVKYLAAKIARLKKLTDVFFFVKSMLMNTRIGQNMIGGERMSDEITPEDLRQVLAWLDKETLVEFKRNQPELWAKSQSDVTND